MPSIRHQRHYRLLVALVVTAVLLMSYQERLGPLKPFGFVSTPLDFLNSSLGSLSSFWGSTLQRITLREKHVNSLRDRLEKLQYENSRLPELARENQRLRELLTLSNREQRYLTSARVVSRGSDPWARVFVLDKGSAHSVKKNMAVITAKGLLGKVRQVRRNHSTVLLLSDARFRAAVRLEGSRAEGIYSGTGSHEGTLQYMGKRARAAKGEKVLTSGLDDLFPPGIAVGRISGVSASGSSLFLDVQVTPFVDTSEVEEVVILK